MLVREIIDSKAIAIQRTEAASNKIPYLGEGLFPAKKKSGLDLKWIKGHKGVPVSLMPSTFDAKATLRSREGFQIMKTEMPFFREGYLIKEQDRQDLRRVAEMSDPLYSEIVTRIYDDINNLLDAADVVPERMVWQLLAPTNGVPKISIQANGVTYAYNYDPNGEWATNHYLDVTGTATNKWSDAANSDPLEDARTLQEKIEIEYGVRPTVMVVSSLTMGYLRKNQKVRDAILTQTEAQKIYMSDNLVKQVFLDNLGITIVPYAKKFKTEAGVATSFYPDGYASLIPAGSLGNMWYGVTPEEDIAAEEKSFDVAVINGKAAIAVTHTLDPVQTKTIASEIVLPSFERMDECGVIKCY